tara:strand:+ start:1322 stop:1933 length:612 start_codon:yes stop_codon:yes gene_type:complete
MDLRCNKERNRDICRRYAAEELIDWYVVMPSPGKTPNAVRELRLGGLAVFEPMLTERRLAGTAARMHGRRAGCLYRSALKRTRVDVLVPMFPGYIFVRARDVDDLARIYRTAWVDGILCGAGDHPIDMPAAAMAWLRWHNGSPKTEAPPLFRRGDSVKVNDGPMTSFVGVVDRVEGDDRVRILIDILGAIRPVSFPSESLTQQ